MSDLRDPVTFPGRGEVVKQATLGAVTGPPHPHCGGGCIGIPPLCGHRIEGHLQDVRP